MQTNYKIDINNLVIPYDRDRNYNDPQHGGDPDTYIPPYSSYRFNSVYEGVILEIHLVDHCNLNCASCNHFCPIAEPWYITPEELRNQLTAAKNNIPNIKLLILIGGEPTLHKDLLELCRIAREIFPDKGVDIGVFSNGIRLEEVVENKDEYSKLNIGFSICSYPSYTNDEQVKELEKNKCGHFCNTRVFMQQTLVDEKGEGNYIDNYYNCSKHQLPCFTLRDYKLMICPFMEHSRHYFKKKGLDYPLQESDYLDIRTINNDLDILQKYIFTPKQYCKYCYHGGEHHIWALSSRKTDEFDTLITENFFYNYKEYDRLMNPSKEYYLQCLYGNTKDAVHMDYASGSLEEYDKRYGKGKIDIIIPYYKEDDNTIIQLINTLSSQTIINDCVIYLISDESPKEYEYYFGFKNAGLNCVFLKTEINSGPGAARQLGLDRSYNNYIHFLDADDYYKTPTALEEMYNKAIEIKADALFFGVYSDDPKNISRKNGVIFKRELIENGKARFNNYYFGEDYLFEYYLAQDYRIKSIINLPDKKEYDWMAYGLLNNKQNLSSRDKPLTRINISSLLVRYIHFKECEKHIQTDYGYLKEIIEHLNKIYSYLDDPLQKALGYYILYKIYTTKNYSIYFDEDVIDNLLLADFSNNHLLIVTEDKYIEGEKNIKDYIINNLKLLANDKFMKNIIEDSLIILKGEDNE